MRVVKRLRHLAMLLPPVACAGRLRCPQALAATAIDVARPRARAWHNASRAAVRGGRLAAGAQLGLLSHAPQLGPVWHTPDGQLLSLLQARSAQTGASTATQAFASSGGSGAGDAGAAAAAPPDVRIVDTEADAKAVVKLLLAQDNSGYPTYHAVDTEVADIDVTKETPVSHGKIVCFSIYCGPEMDFGNGTRRVWVDVLTGGAPVLNAFKPYLENDDIKKVWHNYAFDRHIFENEGIKPQGFGGDTMHMARLWNSSRTGKGYSLEALTKDNEVMKEAMELDGADDDLLRSKQSMRELFAKPNQRKDGTDGRLLVMPSITELQTSADTRYRWIDYSTLDAQATWLLRESLECKLRNMPVEACKELLEKAEEAEESEDKAAAMTRVAAAATTSSESAQKERNPTFKLCSTMWDFYLQYWRPFGELLVDMERNGMLVDKEQLQVAETLATKYQSDAEDAFRSWAVQRCEDARWMNVGSGAQIRQLLYAGLPGKQAGQLAVPLEREFKVPNEEWVRWDASGRQGSAPKKQRTITLRGIVSPPITPTVFTTSGLPSTSALALRALVGKPGTAAKLVKQWDEAQAGADADAALSAVEKEATSRLGTVFKAFGGGRAGLEAGAAIDALCEASAVETLLTNFIVPLQGSNLRGPEGRVHCSLNINTETGRLSARRPNLQNQPALEKDRYGIRRAFTCEPGNTLIVADYGQLELRLLAHMANCKSMLEAFRLGGDFHSRTALGMYPHVRAAVSEGRCLLEWDGPENEAPAPLLKDMFAVERRKAKILNFSIAYGKTKHGLSRDWNVSLEEAEATVNAWYSDRPEVKAWQEEQHRLVQRTGRVCTLLGRQRHLPDALASKGAAKAHALRAAINTPIQGGAADIAMLAMLALQNSDPLKKMGWRLLMQVHDEVILEGSESTADAALEVVRHAMQNPFNGKNLLHCSLDVSASYARDWYTAK